VAAHVDLPHERGVMPRAEEHFFSFVKVLIGIDPEKILTHRGGSISTVNMINKQTD
jgi:hypothetical protein